MMTRPMDKVAFWLGEQPDSSENEKLDQDQNWRGKKLEKSDFAHGSHQ